MKKLLLISILALNYNVAQADTSFYEKQMDDIPEKNTKVPPPFPSNDAEAEFLDNVKNMSLMLFLAGHSVTCGLRSLQFYELIAESVKVLTWKNNDMLLAKSPKSSDYAAKVNHWGAYDSAWYFNDISGCEGLIKKHGPEIVDAYYYKITGGYH